MEINSCTQIPLFRPGSVHSGSLSWDNCGWVFSDKLHVSSFLERFPHYAWTVAQSAHSDFLGSRTALLPEWPGSFMCHCSNKGVERTPNKSQHAKLTLEKKILLPLQQGFNLATFRAWVQLSTNKLSQLPELNNNSSQQCDWEPSQRGKGQHNMVK